MAYQILKSTSGVPESANKCEVMIESEADLESLPEEMSVGSIAYTASMDLMYMKGLDGAWAQIGG